MLPGMLASPDGSGRVTIYRAAIAVISIFVAAGCSSGAGSAANGASTAAGGGGPLSSALAHVADTSNNRSSIYFDDTAGLYRLTGPSPDYAKGFGVLIGLGAGSVAGYAQALPDTGLDLAKESFAITAGSPPATLTLVDGGQDASRVTSHMTRLGWKPDGPALAAPPLTAAAGSGSYFTLVMATVRASGTDAAFGGAGADLTQIGSPAGPTLATDPQVSALTSCLGAVVAAAFEVGRPAGPDSPAELAVGVRTPASGTAVPQAVACAAWPTEAAASQYAAALRTALSTGKSVTGEPYATLLTQASVTAIGGGQHIVQWTASSPARANQVFQMLDNKDLPGLSTCAHPSVAGCH
jgi:hypothetical protein